MTRLLDEQELARVLGVSVEHIGEMARTVRLPFMLTGQRVLVSEHDVCQWRSAVSPDRCK